MNKEAQLAFDTLRHLISSPNIRKSFETLIHSFLNANGNPRPEHAKAKSSSAISRMLNQYQLPARLILKTVRAIIGKLIWQYFSNSKKRRPKLELIIDLTTLEKTGEFENLPLSYFNEKYGLHVVVLYVVIGNQRFPWAIRLWRGKGQTTWTQHALSMLRCIPSWFTERFICQVKADTGFGNNEFIEGCSAMGLPLVVGIPCDRKTEQGWRLEQLKVQGGVLMLNGCSVPVYVARYKLWHKKGTFEWRYVLSTVGAEAKTIIRHGKRRWRIEAFFKTMKSRFGLDQFGQRTLTGVLRFFLIAFIAYLLTFWTSPPLGDEENPNWIALAREAQLWLVTWVVAFELAVASEQLNEVLKQKALVVS